RSWMYLRVLALPEQPAQDLARRGLWNRRDEDEAPRPLEAREVPALPAEAVELLGGHAGARHDEGGDALAPPLIDLSDDRHVLDVRMARKDLLDLHRVDVLATADEIGRASCRERVKSW